MVRTTVSFKKPRLVDVTRLPKDKAGGFMPDLNAVVMNPSQSPRQYFLTGIHEIFHAMFPELEEDEIFKLERKYATVMWQLVLNLNKRKRKKKRNVAK